MITTFVLSQILIGVAFMFDLASFQFKERKYTLVCFAIAAGLISTHFFLLGAITAGAVVAVSTVRFAVAFFTTNKRVMWFFLGVVFLLGCLTYDGFEDILITIAMMLATFSAFSANAKNLRFFMAGGTTLTIIHNILIFTPAGIALEVFFLGSNLFSYWRFYLKNK